MKISILSNINLFKLINRLGKVTQVYEPVGYGNWIQALMSDNGAAQYVFCIIDGNQMFTGIDVLKDTKQAEKRIIESLDYVVQAADRHPGIKYLVSDLDIVPDRLYSLKNMGVLGYLELKWKEKLAELSEACENIYLFPLKDVITYLGRKEAYSEKMWYLASSRFSNKAEEMMEKIILNITSALEGKRKKCLLLDLDNTLWGGVIGEDGMEGVALSEHKEGARYKDFQKHIKSLKEQGVILGIVSKNNEAEAKEMIDSHPDMVLKWDDFAVKKINWERKSENICQIQKELNISLDSMVFVDDSPIERGEVKGVLPDVCVPEFPKSSVHLQNFIQELYWRYFLAAELTPEDMLKTEMYHQQRKRAQEKKKYESLDDYLISLDTRIYIEAAKEKDISRMVQLLNKTNQFNLTAKRYSEAEIRSFLNNEAFDLWIMETEDRFGKNGKSILLIVEKTENTVRLDSFLMSCRIMGRKLEEDIIYELECYYQKLCYEKMRAEYVRTKKNKPVETFYESIGFSILWESEEKKEYEYLLKNKQKDKFSEIIWKD